VWRWGIVEIRSIIWYCRTMTKLEKIEKEIASLDSSDVRKLSEWFAAYEADLWDKQIAKDADGGKLDALIEKAKRDIAEGKVSPL
jgi:hypothetical protein